MWVAIGMFLCFWIGARILQNRASKPGHEEIETETEKTEKAEKAKNP